MRFENYLSSNSVSATSSGTSNIGNPQAEGPSEGKAPLKDSDFGSLSRNLIKDGNRRFFESKREKERAIASGSQFKHQAFIKPGAEILIEYVGIWYTPTGKQTLKQSTIRTKLDAEDKQKVVERIEQLKELHKVQIIDVETRFRRKWEMEITEGGKKNIEQVLLEIFQYLTNLSG